MELNRVVKKELTREELLDLVLSTLNQIHNNYDPIFAIGRIEKMLTKALSGEWTVAWIKDDKSDTLYSATVVKGKKTFVPTNKGFIGQCYKNKEPIFLKQIETYPDYDTSVDNILGAEQKDVIFYPIRNSENKLIGIIQISNHKRDLQQFIASDVDKVAIVCKNLSSFFDAVQKGIYSSKEHQIESIDVEKSIDSSITKLRQERDKAEAMMASSTRFLAEIAHEIRTPMNAVMGFLELLQMDEQDEEKQLYLDTAIKSGNMMVALVNDLLDFSKIEQGMMELETLVFNPIEEFTTMGPLFSSRMKKGDINFHTFIDPNMPAKIISDPHRVKQILSNLLGNSVKFTPHGGRILLEVTYEKSTNSLLFSVSDTGKGIAKNRLTDIFSPYKQEESSTARKFGGTGLGLSISQNLSNLYGGKLEVESEEGKGSRFFFSLPLKDKIVDAPMIHKQDLYTSLNIALIFNETCKATSDILERYFEAFGISNNKIKKYDNWQSDGLGRVTHVFCGGDTINKESIQKLLDIGITVTIMKADIFTNYKEGLKGKVYELSCAFGPDKLYRVMFEKDLLKEMDKTIELNNKALIVDDNSINIQFLKAVLSRLKLESDGALDGKEAVASYKRSMENKTPYRLIFMDESMPNMTGLEATQLILDIEKANGYPHIPIIGLSGDASSEHRQKCIDAGMDDSITKPVHVKVISDLLDKYRG